MLNDSLIWQLDWTGCEVKPSEVSPAQLSIVARWFFVFFPCLPCVVFVLGLCFFVLDVLVSAGCPKSIPVLSGPFGCKLPAIDLQDCEVIDWVDLCERQLGENSCFQLQQKRLGPSRSVRKMWRSSLRWLGICDCDVAHVSIRLSV